MRLIKILVCYESCYICRLLMYIGFISEYISLVGNTPVDRDLLHMYIIGEVIEFELAFSIIFTRISS